MRNLLPYNEKKTINHARRVRMVTVGLVALTLLAFSAGLLLLPTKVGIASRYALWQGEVQQLEDAGAAVSAEKLRTDSARAEKLREGFAGASYSPVSAIVIAEQTAPEGVVLSGFAYTAGEDRLLTIQGVVSTREVLQRYVDALGSHPEIEMVDNSVTNYIKQRDNEFTLSITLL